MMHLMLKILEHMQFPSVQTPMLCRLVDQTSDQVSQDSEINTDDWNLSDKKNNDTKFQFTLYFGLLEFARQPFLACYTALFLAHT